MFRQIMFGIITQLGHAQTYNQVVRSVFLMTGTNTLYNNNNNNNKNKRCATHGCDNDF